ncbi:MAG: hypothetical protein EPN55_09405 [Gammaproteobacteria bacterium]|nr:MAG: hypothetical protein EPN55_09405 [Gammaproteobacteria bacterium]
MDPITAVGAGLAVIGSKDILVKILGPTADYVGGELKNLVQKCNVNLDNIFIRAQAKLGPRLDEPGTVSPRVLKHILDEGRFCEDSIVADYYGGVLASSKSEIDRDDRGVAVLATIKSLSVYQLRLHYLFYSIVYGIYNGKGKSLGTDRNEMSVYIPLSVYMQAMDFGPHEEPGAILIHSVEGLVRSGLVESRYSYGSKEHLAKTFSDATEPGLIMTPSVYGAEVFLWGQGIKGATGHEVVNSSLKLPPPILSVQNGALPVNN